MYVCETIQVGAVLWQHQRSQGERTCNHEALTDNINWDYHRLSDHGSKRPSKRIGQAGPGCLIWRPSGHSCCLQAPGFSGLESCKVHLNRGSSSAPYNPHCLNACDEGHHCSLCCGEQGRFIGTHDDVRRMQFMPPILTPLAGMTPTTTIP